MTEDDFYFLLCVAEYGWFFGALVHHSRNTYGEQAMVINVATGETYF